MPQFWPMLTLPSHIDASRERLGDELYQEHDGHLGPVAYVSQSLTLSERNYITHIL